MVLGVSSVCTSEEGVTPAWLLWHEHKNKAKNKNVKAIYFIIMTNY